MSKTKIEKRGFVYKLIIENDCYCKQNYWLKIAMDQNNCMGTMRKGLSMPWERNW